MAAPARLDEITTSESVLHDPGRFVLRYSRAIRNYIRAILGNDHDAEDASQELLLKILARGVAHPDPGRGRYRDYLRAAARNVALTHKHRGKRPVTDADLAALPDSAAAEREWLAGWRAALVDAAWRQLEASARRVSGGLGFDALRLTRDFPNETSTQLAARLSESVGRSVTPEAFRQQIHRARKLFAELLIREVKATIPQAADEELQAELAELGFLSLVSDVLPDLGGAGLPR